MKKLFYFFNSTSNHQAKVTYKDAYYNKNNIFFKKSDE